MYVRVFVNCALLGAMGFPPALILAFYRVPRLPLWQAIAFTYGAFAGLAAGLVLLHAVTLYLENRDE